MRGGHLEVMDVGEDLLVLPHQGVVGLTVQLAVLLSRLHSEHAHVILVTLQSHGKIIFHLTKF